jgi:hypothetical protein
LPRLEIDARAKRYASLSYVRANLVPRRERASDLPPAFQSIIKFHLYWVCRILVSEALPVVPPESHHRDTVARTAIINSQPIGMERARMEVIDSENKRESEIKPQSKSRWMGEKRRGNEEKERVTRGILKLSAFLKFVFFKRRKENIFRSFNLLFNLQIFPILICVQFENYQAFARNLFWFALRINTKRTMIYS